MTDKPYKELMNSLEEIFVNGWYSDFTITCGPSTYKVHKAVVCPRSEFFAAACNGGFKEASTGVIDLKEDDPEIVRLMVHYFYHLDYQHQNQLPSVNRVNLSNEDITNVYLEKDLGHPNLTLHAKVYALGEKYAIAGLKALALRKFREEADVSWDRDEFLLAAEEVYTSTVDHDRSMRQAVVETICRHPEVLDKQAAQDAVKGSELCFDVMMKFKKGYQGLFPSVSATKKRLSRFGSAHGPSW